MVRVTWSGMILIFPSPLTRILFSLSFDTEPQDDIKIMLLKHIKNIEVDCFFILYDVQSDILISKFHPKYNKYIRR
ncbi:hypothetical protein D3C72_2024090 [compost metagenome]